MSLLLLLVACKGRIFDPKGTGGDADGDGYELSVDCDDGNEDVHPGAEEVCDHVDQDCDGEVDEGVTGDGLLDEGGDGFGALGSSACPGDEGVVDRGGDCDDEDASVHPEAREVCNGWDDDCNGKADDQDPGLDIATATTWTVDKDGDGWGAEGGDTVRACEAPVGYADNGDDCNDNDASVQPTSYWKDGDGDSFGNPEEQLNTCQQPPSGYSDKPGDCDDLDRFTYPGATELCDDKDNACDGTLDDGGLASFYDLSTWRDVSSELSGVDGDPAEWISDKKGALHLCEGTWYATLEFRHSVDVVGHGAAVLDAGLVRSVLYLEGGSLTVKVSDVELTGGEADGAALGLSDYPAGGGLFCRGASTVVLEGVKVRANRGYMGAGVYSEECDLTLRDSSLVMNMAIWTGGGLAVTGGQVRVEDSVIFRNEAGNNGGGLYLGWNSTEPELTLVDTEVSENGGASLGGGASVYAATLRCEGGAGDFGFFGNIAQEEGGAVHLYEESTLISAGCDWGEGGTDNDPDDVGPDNPSFGADEDFTCTTDGGCG